MGFSFKRWIQNAVGRSEIVDVDCNAFFDAAEEYRVRELAFWCCVNMVASSLGRCDFRTYEQGREIQGRLHYCWNVQPNINQNSTAFFHKLAAKLYQENEALIVPVPNEPLFLQEDETPNYFVADNWDTVIPDSNGFPDMRNLYQGITVGDVSYRKVLPEEKVFHLTLNHCNIQPVIKGIYEAYVKLVTAAVNNYTWTNGQHWKVHVKQVASGQEKWDEIFQKMLESQIRSFLTNGSAILPELDGDEYENVGKPTDAARDASHIRSIFNDIFDFTANAFLIPPVLLRGQVEGTADAVKRFLTNCVDPLADQIGEEFTRKIYGFSGWKRGNRIRVDSSAIQHFNLFENAASVEKLIGSGFSYNDVQRAAGAPEIDEPWADQHFLTKNFAKAEDVLNGTT